MEDVILVVNDGNITLQLTANPSITSNMTFTTERFTYGTDPLTLANTPLYVLQPIFCDADPMFEGSDYTRIAGDFTITNELKQPGSIITITYAY